MEKYINTEKAKKAVYWDAEAIESIEQVPTADVRENVHGKWIYSIKPLARGGYVSASMCSVCKKRIMPYSKPNYCPNCGTRMDQ